MLAYKFRLYPNKEEERKLLWAKEVCRRVYNKFLELYNAGEHNRFKLQALLPVWKRDDADLKRVHSKVLQYELHRLFANLAALRELKNVAARSASCDSSPRSVFAPSPTTNQALDSNLRTKSSASCIYRR